MHPCTNATTFLNVDNMPEDTYKLDEVNQRFQRQSWEPRLPNHFFFVKNLTSK
jgi:hypothetical protein